MNWNEEASYIESIDYDNPGTTFNHDTDCFYRYCLMQYEGAVKAQAWEAARRINHYLNSGSEDTNKPYVSENGRTGY